MSSRPPLSRAFLLDKAPGISSFRALGDLKKRIGTKKVGHTGTLDPFATGLLIAMSGKMTKAAALVTDMEKEYAAVIRFGEETDTCDRVGEVVARSDIPEYPAILKAAESFKGEISQVPPSFSAVKIRGRRAYESARRGIPLTLPARRVRIENLELISWRPPDLFLRIRCSKGTYIRSIARDWGLACGSRAHCAELRRTAIGPFSVDMASPEGLSPPDFFDFMGVPVSSVDNSAAAAMRTGRPIADIGMYTALKEETALIIDERGVEAALLEKIDGQWVYRMVFD